MAEYFMSTISVQRAKRFDYLPQRITNRLWSKGYRILGLTPRSRTHDRKILEQSILPFLTQSQFQRILFVGCDWYTQQYALFFQDREYWTIDGRQAVASYGSNRHIVGLIQDIDQHFDNHYFDAIVCNGVYGYGLDQKADIEQTVTVCHQQLRHGGLFILGWNATPDRTPVPLSHISSLQQMQPYTFKPLGTSEYLTRTHNRHVFSFYRARHCV